MRTCICRCVQQVNTQTEILILQHPLEVSQAKGTGRLLHLNLPASRIIIGETFDQSSLHALLHTSIDGSQRQPVLLYPDTPSMPAISLADTIAPNNMTLVVLDATWKKSRKMLYANPQLQQLPRLLLNETPLSEYRIRKAHRPDQLSTYEATCLALAQIEPNPDNTHQLLTSFNHFIEAQLAWIPE